MSMLACWPQLRQMYLGVSRASRPMGNRSTASQTLPVRYAHSCIPSECSYLVALHKRIEEEGSRE